MASSCEFCQKPLPQSKPGFAFCVICGGPAFSGNPASPFEVMGVEKKFDLNRTELEDRYYELSKRLHPDRFAAGSDKRLHERSQQLSALLNHALQRLRTPQSRLETLLELADVVQQERGTAQKSQIPMDLAEEYFEIQETMMECPGNAGPKIAEFRGRLNTQNESTEAAEYELAGRMDWSNPRKEDLEKLVQMRQQQSYVRSMLENLERLGA